MAAGADLASVALFLGLSAFEQLKAVRVMRPGPTRTDPGV